MQEQTLNNLYSMFFERKISRSKFEGLVFIYLLNNQAKIITKKWINDEYEEFISWFYPRLNKAIDTYRETGSSFEAFVINIVRAASREYRMKIVINEVTEQTAWNAQIPEYFTMEEPPAYSYDRTNPEITKIFLQIKGRKNPKQLLALILKCYYFISEEFIERISAFTEIDTQILREMIEKLRIMREKREEYIYRMKERIYGQFYRCIVYEHRLSYVIENSTPYIKLKSRLDKARKRLEKMRSRKIKVRVCPSNREIAGVIGVTKGSVDASLYKLKAKLSALNALAEKSTLN